jgi:hypothetical protein
MRLYNRKESGRDGGMADAGRAAFRKWRELAHFLYGRGFWYADPLVEIKGLSEDELFWVPDPNALSALWHVGHIAHREKTHIGGFLQGLQGDPIPHRYHFFGPEWWPADQLRNAVGPVEDVFAWVREVRRQSHEYIDSLTEDQMHGVPSSSPGEGLSVAHWLFITVAHTAVHVGRIQMLHALIKGERERAC